MAWLGIVTHKNIILHNLTHTAEPPMNFSGSLLDIYFTEVQYHSTISLITHKPLIYCYFSKGRVKKLLGIYLRGHTVTQILVNRTTVFNGDKYGII